MYSVALLQIAHIITTLKNVLLSFSTEVQHLINFVDKYVVCYVNSYYLILTSVCRFCSMSVSKMSVILVPFVQLLLWSS